MNWGYHQILNLYGCDKDLMGVEHIKEVMTGVCKVVDMIPHGEPIADRFGEGRLEGNSGMMFIETSTITIHTDETEDRVFVDIFSCQDFNRKKSREYINKAFRAKIDTEVFMERG